MTKRHTKPDKSHKDFPLFPHQNGQWCKKIRGKQYFFGVWVKPDEAEAEYLRVREYLQAGRMPPAAGVTRISMHDLCNKFIRTKRAMVDTQELSIRMFHDYHAGCAEILQLIEAASPAMKAMILLAINGGLGNSDLANLPKSAFQGDWMQFPRVKTGIDRRIPLWPETATALTDAIERRPVAKDPAEAGLCFITKYGHRWVRQGPSGTSNVDKIIDAFNKLLTDLDLKRDRIGFYALRHTFETIAGGCGDQVAVEPPGNLSTTIL